MKRLCLVALICFALGCTRSFHQVLPPIFESQYPIVIGITSVDDRLAKESSSILLSIALKSGFACGAVNEPFDSELVDIILFVREISVTPRVSGFIPKRCEIKGNMVIDLLNNQGDLIKEYRAEGTAEQSSLNPFIGCNDAQYLIADLITSIIDDIDEDFQIAEPEKVRKEIEEDKETEASVFLAYPTLSDLKRAEIRANSNIRTTLPPSNVMLYTSSLKNYGDASYQLYYDAVRDHDGTREWLFSGTSREEKLPFSAELEYQLKATDAAGNSYVITSGKLNTISRGLYRIKQAEVLTHGTIITAFGGLIVVMLLYSL